MSFRKIADLFIERARATTSDDLLELLQRGTLDEYYMALVESSDLLHRIAERSVSADHLHEAARLIDRKEAEVLEFYHRFFDQHDVIGEISAARNPDVVLVLACKDAPVMRRRVRAALDLIRSNPGALVVLCGGGFAVDRTEAEVMREELAARGLDEDRPVILEEDSIDTIGNAVFSKLRLRQELSTLASIRRLLVVTSEFHAVRSLSIFRRVYGSAFEIGVLAANISDSIDEEVRRAQHELRTDCRSSREIFSVREPFSNTLFPIEDGDEAALLQQLLLNHDLYRHRYDLMRKYRPLLEEIDR